jgi:hypothetical protein
LNFSCDWGDAHWRGAHGFGTRLVHTCAWPGKSGRSCRLQEATDGLKSPMNDGNGALASSVGAGAGSGKDQPSPPLPNG